MKINFLKDARQGRKADTMEKTVKVVVVIEGGNVQRILSNVPGVQVVKVDYDVEGSPREDLKRVAQYETSGKKTYQLAFVSMWGEAEPAPESIGRFFRNAERTA